MEPKANAADLEQLSGAAEAVYSRIVAGESPVDAVCKIASERKLGQAWTERLCELTNRMLSVQQVEASAWGKKASEHPLVQPNDVINTLFPKNIPAAMLPKAAAAVVAPKMTKAASAKTGESAFATKDFRFNKDDLLQRMYQTNASLKKAHDAFRVFQATAEYEITRRAKKAAAAINESGVSFKDIDERAQAFYGDAGSSAMAVISGYVKGASRWTGQSRAFTTNPWNQSPFTMVREVVHEMRKQAFQYPIEELAVRCAVKAAAISDKLQGVLSDMLAPSKESAPEAVDATALMMSSLSPDDTVTLRTIRAQQALSEAINDSVIEKYPIPQIVQAYNRISDLLPRSAWHSATLIPMLRHQLENPDRSTFDIEQDQKVELALAKQEDPGTVA